MNYAIADIHGHSQMFGAMLELINLGPDDNLYVLGDLADRGPDPVGVIRLAMSHPRVQVSRGNHDQMLLEYFRGNPAVYERWMRNGGQVTLEAMLDLADEEREEILDWLEALPHYFLLDKYILVHAGLRMRPHLDLDDLLRQQELNDLIWIRDEFYQNPAVPGYTVIFGHTRSVKLWNDNIHSIWHDPEHGDKIGIDCGAYRYQEGGRLACLRLDDLQEFYVESPIV